MPREIEAKYKVESFAVVEKALAAAGAVFLCTCRETDQFFDTRSHGLRRRDSGLRLRTVKVIRRGKNHMRRATDLQGIAGLCEERPMLTFKGPRDNRSSIKIRQEIQTHVYEAAAVAEILTQLGYQPALIVRKTRSSYRLGRCRVELDLLPGIGKFVEVEGPGERAVRDCCRLLGLSGKPITTPYVAMVAQRAAAR